MIGGAVSIILPNLHSTSGDIQFRKVGARTTTVLHVRYTF